MKGSKNMKKILVIALAVGLFSFFSVSAKAEANDNYVLSHGPDINDPEYVAEIEALRDRIYANYPVNNDNNARIAYPIIEQISLNVPLHKQETKYYCGPASTQMVLDYKGVSMSQSDLADALGTTVSGTYVYRICNGLNLYLGENTYQYVLTSSISFFSGLKNSIAKDRPVVCHVKTGNLPIYKELGLNNGHYIVATGYYYMAESANPDEDFTTIYYNDPHYNDELFGAHSCSLEEMVIAINNNAGYYIMSAK